MKIDFSKINVSTFKIIFYIYFIMFALGIMVFLGVSWFLYQNFYLTIAQSEEVIILRKTIAPVDINIDKFNQVVFEIEQKQEIKIEESDIIF